MKTDPGAQKIAKLLEEAIDRILEARDLVIEDEWGIVETSIVVGRLGLSVEGIRSIAAYLPPLKLKRRSTR